MRYVNIVLCILMVLFAAVQYNDPDAFLWIAVYLVPAIWAGLAAFRLDYLRRNAPMAALAVCMVAGLLGVVYYWPDTPGFWRKDVWWIVETAREGMGMMIVTVVMLVAFISGWAARSRT